MKNHWRGAWDSNPWPQEVKNGRCRQIHCAVAASNLRHAFALARSMTAWRNTSFHIKRVRPKSKEDLEIEDQMAHQKNIQKSYRIVCVYLMWTSWWRACQDSSLSPYCPGLESLWRPHYTLCWFPDVCPGAAVKKKRWCGLKETEFASHMDS